jgi:FkbM family methyltransferase
MAPFDYDHVTVYREVFEEHCYDFALIPFRPDMAIDCGAHIGSFSAIAAVRYPGIRLLAFEPDSKNRWFLHRNLRPLAPHAVISAAAVAAHDGTARFNEGGHWAHVVEDGQASPSSTEVPLRSLPDAIRESAARHLLLKMDIEGAELALLPQLIPHLPRTTALFIETHGGTHAWNSCRAALSEAGFVVRLLRSRDYQGVPDAFVDAFALRTD